MGDKQYTRDLENDGVDVFEEGLMLGHESLEDAVYGVIYGDVETLVLVHVDEVLGVGGKVVVEGQKRHIVGEKSLVMGSLGLSGLGFNLDMFVDFLLFLVAVVLDEEEGDEGGAGKTEAGRLLKI